MTLNFIFHRNVPTTTGKLLSVCKPFHFGLQVSLQFLVCTSKYMPISYHKALFELPVKKVDVKVDVLWRKKMSGNKMWAHISPPANFVQHSRGSSAVGSLCRPVPKQQSIVSKEFDVILVVLFTLF